MGSQSCGIRVLFDESNQRVQAVKEKMWVQLIFQLLELKSDPVLFTITYLPASPKIAITITQNHHCNQNGFWILKA